MVGVCIIGIITMPLPNGWRACIWLMIHIWMLSGMIISYWISVIYCCSLCLWPGPCPIHHCRGSLNCRFRILLSRSLCRWLLGSRLWSLICLLLRCSLRLLLLRLLLWCSLRLLLLRLLLWCSLRLLLLRPLLRCSLRLLLLRPLLRCSLRLLLLRPLLFRRSVFFMLFLRNNFCNLYTQYTNHHYSKPDTHFISLLSHNISFM